MTSTGRRRPMPRRMPSQSAGSCRHRSRREPRRSTVRGSRAPGRPQQSTSAPPRGCWMTWQK
jgi:hypothetical protein